MSALDLRKAPRHRFFGMCIASLFVAVAALGQVACQGSVVVDEKTLAETTQGGESALVEQGATESSQDTAHDASESPSDEKTQESLASEEITPTEYLEPSPEQTTERKADCVGKPSPPTDRLWRVSHDGVERSFRVFVPPSYASNQAMPIVLNFHGVANDAWTQVLLSGMESKAEEAGFIAVHPEGRALPSTSWNAGTCCQPAASWGVDDVGFVRALLDRLEEQLCVDRRRIYATGISNGGMLAYRLACEVSDRIAAIAPVAASMVYLPCKPPRPFPVMIFHGTLDSIVPYAGNPLLGYPSLSANVEHWVAHNGCSDQKVRRFSQGDASCDAYPTCRDDAQVESCTILGGGHTWPGGLPVPQLGYTSLSLRATDAMWDFFSKHPMPSRSPTP